MKSAGMTLCRPTSIGLSLGRRIPCCEFRKTTRPIWLVRSSGLGNTPNRFCKSSRTRCINARQRSGLCSVLNGEHGLRSRSRSTSMHSSSGAFGVEAIRCIGLAAGVVMVPAALWSGGLRCALVRKCRVIPICFRSIPRRVKHGFYRVCWRCVANHRWDRWTLAGERPALTFHRTGRAQG